jgi:guanine deaminase
MNEFMRVAIEEAREGVNLGHGGPFGAVIVKNGSIISQSHNTVVKEQDATCHAEMNAIRQACKLLGSFDLSMCELYTTGKPCKMCEAAIGWAKITKVYYGNTYEEAMSIGFNEETCNSSDIEMVKIEEFETNKLLEEWNKLPNKDFY